MKSPLKPKSSAASAQEHLLAALETAPNVGPALTALKTATDRFNAIREKLNDETVEASAVRREADAHQALIRAQALIEIGDATAGDVSTARLEHQSALDALRGVLGRDEVLADELRKAQRALAEGHDDLAEAMGPWRVAAIKHARETAEEGVRLIQLAAQAFTSLNAGAGYVPRHSSDVTEWLVVNSIGASGELAALPIADTSRSAIHLLARAGDLSREEIQVPRRKAPAHLPPDIVAVGKDRVEPEYNTFGRPLLEKLSDADRKKLASQPEITSPGASIFRNPGMPASLTHDPLGNPLPEAKSLLARQKRRSAPYDDGRGGAEEVAR